MIVAGIDVGNHTTEIVIARVRDGAVEPVAHGQAPTRGRKGSRESLEGAAALLHRLEVEAAVAVDQRLLATLRPVDTSTVPLPPASSPRSAGRAQPAKAGRENAGRHRIGRRPTRPAG